MYKDRTLKRLLNSGVREIVRFIYICIGLVNHIVRRETQND